MWIVWFVIGACVGSFLNVCIYRLPREQSIVRPRSRCPHCKRAIAWYDNLPLLSFLVLRGACRACHRPIAWRYPAVELVSGLAAVAVLERFGTGALGVSYFAFVCALITASVIDLQFQIIPDEITVFGRGIGLGLSLLVPALHGTASHVLAAGYAVVGALVGGGLLYLTGLLGDLLFRRESMGWGDVKLLAMAGTLLGWKLVALTFTIAPLLALLPGLFVLIRRRSHVIPYGPFLSLGLVIALFFGHDLLRVSGVEDTVSLLWSYYGGR